MHINLPERVPAMGVIVDGDEPPVACELEVLGGIANLGRMDGNRPTWTCDNGHDNRVARLVIFVFTFEMAHTLQDARDLRFQLPRSCLSPIAELSRQAAVQLCGRRC